jgi:hypothetical protein
LRQNQDQQIIFGNDTGLFLQSVVVKRMNGRVVYMQ